MNDKKLRKWGGKSNAEKTTKSATLRDGLEYLDFLLFFIIFAKRYTK